ncbi:MAG TPA: epimerase, partial [Pilimelia sp.]|nr:epimerase [Pilimelia sp.]
GRTENALLELPFRAYMMRPGYIQPLHGIRSKTRLYAALYAVTAPLYPMLRRIAPGAVTTTEQVGRAMIHVARAGAPKRILETRDINALG